MKKFLLALTVLSLLAGCSESTPVVETPTEETSQKVMAPQPFYITALYMENDAYTMNQTFVNWLSESEGSCRTNGEVTYEGSSIPECNPNGFLLMEGDVGLISQNIPVETKVYVKNLGTVLALDSTEMDEEGNFEITLEELMTAFEDNPEFFEVTPFEVEFGTVVVDGQEMSDQISAINEIYIP